MAAVTWTPQALDDLDAACLYIARDSPRIAEVFAARAFEAADRLSEFPQSGRMVPEVGRPEIREVFVYSYRIIYRFLGDTVAVWPASAARSWSCCCRNQRALRARYSS